MRLYLSSVLRGDHSEHLLKMAGGRGARMGVITNALDYIPLAAQRDYARTTFEPVGYFAGYGFDASLLDLRGYFGRTEALLAALG